MSATPGSTAGISAKNQLEESTAKPANGTKLDSFRGSLNTREQAIAERAERRTQRSGHNQALAETQKKHGNELFRKQDYHGAIACYIDAINLDVSNPVYCSNLAAAYLKLECYEEAEDVATAALILDPKFLKARYRRGLARKEQNLLKGAMTDFETILREDPTNTSTQASLAAVLDLATARGELRALLVSEGPNGEDLDDSSTSDDDWPHFDDDKAELAPASDSSDFNHVGNGIACRFYNHDGCARGKRCAFSHAPDEKSVRDSLGKNVCIYYLLSSCKFGDAKCIYRHSKECLPNNGWWNDLEKLTRLTNMLEEEQNAREQRALDALLWKLQGIAPHSHAGSSRGRTKGSGMGKRANGKGKIANGGPKLKNDRGKGVVHNGSRGNKHSRPRDDCYLEKEMEERMANGGFTDDELDDLLSQGVKPWDDDAWAVLNVLNGHSY